MTHHDALWATICYVAQLNNTSCSGLARMCNLDSTTFNQSKRYTAYGQPRWISTETLAKILCNTNTTPVQFALWFQDFINKSDETLV